MPLVRISLRAGRTPAAVKAIGDAVHRALVEAINAPADGRFQVITEHGPEGLLHPPIVFDLQIKPLPINLGCVADELIGNRIRHVFVVVGLLLDHRQLLLSCAL